MFFGVFSKEDVLHWGGVGYHPIYNTAHNNISVICPRPLFYPPTPRLRTPPYPAPSRLSSAIRSRINQQRVFRMSRGRITLTLSRIAHHSVLVTLSRDGWIIRCYNAIYQIILYSLGLLYLPVLYLPLACL